MVKLENKIEKSSGKIAVNKKLTKKSSDKKTEKEKVEERREEVLARGRKFKYPLQYAKHKLMFNTIIIAFVAVLLLSLLGGVMLYKWQNTGDVLYRITRVLPIPVATVDGEGVLFSDYLMFYRSSLMAVEQQSGKLGDGEDAEEVKLQYKIAALESTEKYTYALKLAKELSISVSGEEVNAAFDEHRKVGGTERSEESFLKVLSDNFGLSKDEYKRMLYLLLTKEKVEQEIDKNANAKIEEVKKLLNENGGSLRDVSESMGSKVVYEATGGLVDNKNVDGGRANVAMNLTLGQVSSAFISSNGDGYYFVKLINKTDTQVNYESIKIEFTEFDLRFSALGSEEKISEFIDLEF